MVWNPSRGLTLDGPTDGLSDFFENVLGVFVAVILRKALVPEVVFLRDIFWRWNILLDVCRWSSPRRHSMQPFHSVFIHWPTGNSAMLAVCVRVCICARTYMCTCWGGENATGIQHSWMHHTPSATEVSFSIYEWHRQPPTVYRSKVRVHIRGTHTADYDSRSGIFCHYLLLRNDGNDRGWKESQGIVQSAVCLWWKASVSLFLAKRSTFTLWTEV